MLRVFVSSPDQRTTALSILFGHLSEQERDERIAEVLDESKQGRLSLDGLLLAEEEGEPVGAGLMVVPEDGSIFVWPPAICDDAPYRETADALLQEMACLIDTTEAWLGQCLLEPKQHREREALNRNGFTHLTDLVFMQRPLDEPLPSPLNAAFETIDFTPSVNEKQFAEIIEKTYVDTQDCAELNGTRSGIEALAAHRTAGEFDPSRWKIYRADDADVGVLLLSDHPDQNAWELVYMGIVPTVRGKGYGKEILLRGLHEAKQAGRGTVMLAVDSRNSFAISAYNDLGFVESAIRAVHVRMRQ